MPISGVLLACYTGRLEAVRAAVNARSLSEPHEAPGNALVVVTDTTTLDEDRAEVDALSRLDGVVAAHVVFSHVEDLAEAADG